MDTRRPDKQIPSPNPGLENRQDTPASPAALAPRSHLWELAAIAATIIILLTPYIYLQRSHYRSGEEVEKDLSFVGSQKCASCHQRYFDDWQNSHHDLAMAEATEDSVVGDFENVTYTDPYNGVTSRFFRQEGKFLVETQGPGGALETFEITHTFGVYPLQQYLAPFDGGRLQCLNIAWDAQQQRWYRLPPYEVEGPEDWLHWTQGGQTWNGMCAECHSTRLEKNFDIDTNSYATTWFEIDVGCEACHGPGSSHVRWAERPAMAREPLDDFALATPTGAISSKAQIAICAPCHSRRYQLGNNTHLPADVLDTMVPSLLDEGLYYPDGQIYEEVYVYGSFVQSKMYQHDVRCSDCHDMHSLKLHKDGNDLCLQCHRAAEYDRYEHHFHKREFEGKPSDGHLCVKCHMPGRTYMGIDYRPDHSLRVPRPDLSEALETPNSCSATQCHADKELQWVNDHYLAWYGKSTKPHYGEIIAAGRATRPEAAEGLRTLAQDTLMPVIVRATALSLLRNYPGTPSLETLSAAVEDNDSLIRHTAISALAGLDNESRLRVIGPKLYDPVKGVRIEAAAALASVPKNLIKPADRQALEEGLAEYRQAMLYNSDFAPQRYNLGNLAAALGDIDQATNYYEQAIQIDEQFFPAKVNLAMLLNRNGDNERAAALLREVVQDSPELHEAAYSLGLLLAEMNLLDEAAEMLGRAADGMPGYARPRYNQALALLKLKRYEEGEQALLQVVRQEPENAEYFTTLANLYLGFRMTERAVKLAEMVLQMVPGHPQALELLQLLQSGQN
jgi:tetratricopeptide (TPR) repeat protein